MLTACLCKILAGAGITAIGVVVFVLLWRHNAERGRWRNGRH